MERLYDFNINDIFIIEDLGWNTKKNTATFLVHIRALSPTAISLILAGGNGLNYKSNAWGKNLNLRLERTSRYQ